MKDFWLQYLEWPIGDENHRWFSVWDELCPLAGVPPSRLPGCKRLWERPGSYPAEGTCGVVWQDRTHPTAWVRPGPPQRVGGRYCWLGVGYLLKPDGVAQTNGPPCVWPLSFSWHEISGVRPGPHVVHRPQHVWQQRLRQGRRRRIGGQGRAQRRRLRRRHPLIRQGVPAESARSVHGCEIVSAMDTQSHARRFGDFGGWAQNFNGQNVKPSRVVALPWFLTVATLCVWGCILEEEKNKC